MKVSKQRRRQLEEMASVLEENKNLQASGNDLQLHLLHECLCREDLEVKVLVLEKGRQQMEAEGQSQDEQLSRNTDQQKGMILDPILLMLSVVRRLAMMCSAGVGAQPFPGGHRAADCGKGGGRGKV
jgi:hypothetical protein